MDPPGVWEIVDPRCISSTESRLDPPVVDSTRFTGFGRTHGSYRV